MDFSIGASESFKIRLFRTKHRHRYRAGIPSIWYRYQRRSCDWIDFITTI